MTTAFCTQAELRAYMGITGTTGRYADAPLAAAIGAAGDFLQRQTGRQFEAQATTTKLFTTHGKAYLPIPDLRTATTVTLQGAALVANASYWLIPSRQDQAIFIGIQLRAFRTPDEARWYLGNPEWFDRGLDLPGGPSAYSGQASLPNDLSILGAWGWSAYPAELVLTTKALAAFHVKRPDSMLANVQITPEGNVLQYGQLPPEVREFIAAWRIGPEIDAV